MVQHLRAFNTSCSVLLVAQAAVATPQVPAIKLRDYQEECISRIVSSLDTIRKPAVSLPTGSGKTVIFTSLIPRITPQPGQGNKTLILVNRVEIAKQTVATLKNLMPDLKVCTEMGNESYSTNPDVDVCVASIHTVHKPERLAAFDPKEFKMVIVDEAHHTAARTYQSTLAHFGIDQENSKVYCVGVSATFFRKDKKSLEIFNEIVYHREATEMIDKGHLAKVQVSKYDFEIPEPFTTQKRASNFLFSPTGLEFVLKLWRENQPKFRSTVIFCINKTHVSEVTAKFRAQGIDARGLTSDDNVDDRNCVVNAFKNQEFPILVNCSILSEGTDIPCIDQIIFATPLGSPGLAMQMIGRGLRQFPGKELCNTIFLSPMVKFDTGAGLLPELRGYALVDELEKRVDINGDEQPELKKPEGPMESYGELNCAITSIDESKTTNLMEIFRSIGVEPSGPPRLAWIFYGKHYFLATPHGSSTRMIKIDCKPKKEYVVSSVREYKGHSHNQRGHVSQELYKGDDLDCAREIAERYVADRFFTELHKGYFNPRAKWRLSPATPAQLKLLEKFGLQAVLEHLNKGQASTLLSIKMAGGYKLTDSRVNASLRLGLDLDEDPVNGPRPAIYY